jgi:predicted amidophosphoribosyltransferase
VADDERRRNLGPGGECVCPKCGGRVPHPRGVRCAEERCPNCGGPMLRVGSEHHRLWLDKHGGEQGHKSEGEAGQ